MRIGEAVAVFDGELERWCRAEVVSLNPTRTRVTVAAREWWAILPLTPTWVRPVAVVRAS